MRRGRSVQQRAHVLHLPTHTPSALPCPSNNRGRSNPSPRDPLRSSPQEWGPAASPPEWIR
eukprot:6751581-Alexandrium_andersonii.AAC.1